MGDQSTFDFFRQETSHAEVTVRAEAMSNLVIICALLTPDKVRGDLIPYLQSKLNDADQVLVCLSKALGDVLPFIGGPEHAHTLVSIFEPLCNVEETVVRLNAAKSALKIMSQLDDSHTASVASFVSLVKRLAGDDNAETFYARVSACVLIEEGYRIAPSSDRAALLEAYVKLCNDEMLIVKRCAAEVFPKVVRFADSNLATQDFLNAFKIFIAPEEHATVKVLALEGLLTYCQFLHKTNNLSSVQAELAHIIKLATEDSSWKIRLAVAQNYGEYAKVFSSESINAEIFPGLVQLLQDSEPDVRISACAAGTSFLAVMTPEQFLLEVIPSAVHLTEDTFPNVRKSVAEMCVALAVMIGSDAVGNHMSDLVVKCVGDESPLVRVRVISKLNEIAQKVPALCTRLTPAIISAQKDTAWRVRKSWCLVMPGVAKYMGIPYFTENFLSLYLEMFKDGVSDVRIAACVSLGDMIGAISSAWVYENVYPSIKALSSGDYLLRLTMLEALKALLAADISERFRGEALNLALSCASDSVPNVKICAVKVLMQVCAQQGDDATASRSLVKPVLSEMENDKDKDVKYFAIEALKLC